MAETAFGSLRVDSGTVKPYAQKTLTTYIAGAQTVAAKKHGWIVPFACQVVDARVYADTAPTGANLIVDVNKNGTTLFTTQGNRPTITAGANASSTTLPDVVTLAAGDRITLDVDQVGSGVAGSDLYAAVTVKQLTTD